MMEVGGSSLGERGRTEVRSQKSDVGRTCGSILLSTSHLRGLLISDFRLPASAYKVRFCSAYLNFGVF